MTHLLLIFMFTLLGGRSQVTQIDSFPIAQVRITESLNIYRQADLESDIVGRARWGDRLLIYEQTASWLRTDLGWLEGDGLVLEPAVVHYSCRPKARTDAPEWLQQTTHPLGVAAIFEGQALVYSRSQAAWVDLDQLELLPPTDDLRDFGEQAAYVQILEAALYPEPTEQPEPLSRQPLGKAVTIVSQQGDWVLIRTGDGYYGWADEKTFDRLPLAQARGVMNAGPVNVRIVPQNGSVVTILDYNAPILILARSQQADWLYVRVKDEFDGIEGWVAAQFVDIEGEISDLPVREAQD